MDTEEKMRRDLTLLIDASSTLDTLSSWIASVDVTAESNDDDDDSISFLSSSLPSYVQTLLNRPYSWSDDNPLWNRVNHILKQSLHLISQQLSSPSSNLELLGTLYRIFQSQREFYHSNRNSHNENTDSILAPNTEVSQYFASNIRYFEEELDGFTLLHHRIASSNNLSHIVCILEILQVIQENMNPSFFNPFIHSIATDALSSLQRLDVSQYNTLDKTAIRSVIENLYEMLQASEHKFAFEIVTKCQQIISLKLLGCQSLEKRIHGANETMEIIRAAHDIHCQQQQEDEESAAEEFTSLSVEGVKDWIRAHSLMPLLYGPDTHVEILRRSETLLRFLAYHEWFTTNDLQLCWNLCHHDGGHGLLAKYAQEMLVDLIPMLSQDMLQSVFTLLQEEPKAASTFLVPLCQSAKVQDEIINWYWSVVQEKEEALDEVASRLLEIVQRNVDLLQKILIDCLTNIKHKRSVMLSLKCLTVLLTSSVDISFLNEGAFEDGGAGNIISILLDELSYYCSTNHRTTHGAEVQTRLWTLRYMCLVLSYTFSVQDLQVLWETCIPVGQDNNDDNDACYFFMWIESGLESSSRYIDYSGALFLLEQKFDFSSPVNSYAFSCFKKLFHLVNEDDGGRVGIQQLWEIVLLPTKDCIFEEAVTLLTECYESDRQRFVDICMTVLKNDKSLLATVVMTQSNMTSALEKCLNMLMFFLTEDDDSLPKSVINNASNFNCFLQLMYYEEPTVVSIVWKLLQTLPPNESVLAKVLEDTSGGGELKLPNDDTAKLLYSLSLVKTCNVISLLQEWPHVTSSSLVNDLCLASLFKVFLQNIEANTPITNPVATIFSLIMKVSTTTANSAYKHSIEPGIAVFDALLNHGYSFSKGCCFTDKEIQEWNASMLLKKCSDSDKDNTIRKSFASLVGRILQEDNASQMTSVILKMIPAALSCETSQEFFTLVRKVIPDLENPFDTFDALTSCLDTTMIIISTSSLEGVFGSLLDILTYHPRVFSSTAKSSMLWKHVWDKAWKNHSTLSTATNLLLLLFTIGSSQEMPNATSKLVQSASEEFQLTGPSWGYDPLDEVRLSPFVGLVNPGCICYMNALIQQLFHIDTFRTGLLNNSNNNNEELQRVFAYLQWSDRTFVDPSDFVASHKDIDGNPTDVRVQMDADEFFSLLLDRIDTSLKKSNDNFVTQTFGGKVVNQIITQGGKVSERQEPFFALSLDIKNHESITNSLEMYVKGETLHGENAYYCEESKAKVSALKRVCIDTLPNTLVIHLKRFEFDFDSMTKEKLNDFIKFPPTLDMAPYTKEHLMNENQECQKNCIYRLVGVVVHTGTSDVGHYYSFIQDRRTRSTNETNDYWYEFNDHVVSEFNLEDLGNETFGGTDTLERWNGDTKEEYVVERHQNAYMLVYESLNTETSTTSTTSINSCRYKKEVEADNAAFHNVQCAFTPQMSSLVTGILRQSSSDGDTSSIKLAMSYLFDILVFTSPRVRREAILPLVSVLEATIASSSSESSINSWFVETCVSRNWIQTMLVECDDQRSRSAFSRVVVVATLRGNEQKEFMSQMLQVLPLLKTFWRNQGTYWDVLGSIVDYNVLMELGGVQLIAEYLSETLSRQDDALNVMHAKHFRAAVLVLSNLVQYCLNDGDTSCPETDEETSTYVELESRIGQAGVRAILNPTLLINVITHDLLDNHTNLLSVLTQSSDTVITDIVCKVLQHSLETEVFGKKQVQLMQSAAEVVLDLENGARASTVHKFFFDRTFGVALLAKKDSSDVGGLSSQLLQWMQDLPRRYNGLDELQHYVSVMTLPVKNYDSFSSSDSDEERKDFIISNLKLSSTTTSTRLGNRRKPPTPVVVANNNEREEQQQHHDNYKISLDA